MESEFEIIKSLISFLEAKKGFPKVSFQEEMSVGGRMRADLVIVDPNTNEPLAIFECKRNFDQKRSFEAMLQLKRYKEALGYPDLPSYIVTSGGNLGFTIHLFSGEAVAVILAENFPSYDSLKNRSVANKKRKLKTDTKTTIDQFKISCYISAIVVGLILVADILGCFKFSSQQLSLLGVTVALVLIPYAAKLKILGIEFERQKGNE